jgi:toxin CptA
MLKLSIKRSRYLVWLLLLAHAGAMALLWPLAMPAWGKTMIILAVIASLMFFLGHVALLSAPEAVIAVEIRESGEITVKNRRDEWRECRLSGDSFVSAWLTIMVLAQEGRRIARYVVITPDNVDAEDFRRLRVWLRWAAQRVVKPG